MALKRPSPLEDPPSASSSSSSEEEESEETNGGEEEQENEQTKRNAESEEEDEEETEGEEEEEEKKVNKKQFVQRPSLTTAPQKPQSSDSEGTDSEMHSDEIQPSPTASDFTIKAHSKPFMDSIKPKKSASKTVSPARKQASKRPAESEQKEKETQKKKKSKVSNGEEEESAVEEKKSAITRLWSEDDEIAILKGWIEYQSKKGLDPHADMGAFHEFIKKSLHVDVSRAQLMDKVRRLKKKYQNNAEKGEKGEDPVFSKQHDHKSFELSKKIWGRGAGDGLDNNNSNAKTKSTNNSKAKKTAEVKNCTPLLKEEKPVLLLGDGLKAEGKELKVDTEDFWSIHPRLLRSLELETSPNLSMPEFGKNFIKESMVLIGSKKAKDLEEKWKNLCTEEIALYLKRVELVQEQTKLVLDAIKASKS